jgi:uncharacterized protein
VTPRETRRFLTISLFEGSLCLLADGLGRITGFSPWPSLRSTPEGLAAAAVCTALLFALFHWAYRNPRGPFRGIHTFLVERALPLFSGFGRLHLGCVCLLAGLGEEALFRGWLQGWAQARWGADWGLALSALLFGIAHWITPAYAFCATVIGLALGLLYQVSGGWLAPLATHALYDFFALSWLLQHSGEKFKKI